MSDSVSSSNRFGLLGEHLSHSFSPRIHREISDYAYDLFEVSAECVGDFMSSNELSGFNVTIPYKKTVIPYLAEISPEARRIGAVNTVVRLPNGTWHGENTDYYGFSSLLTSAGINVAGKKVLVLGTGGASVTVHTVLSDMGCTEIVSVSRRGPCNYETVYALHPDAEVIVNTTPVGMYPENGKSPITLARFPKLCLVLDLIYNPARTALLLEAERLGIPSKNGLLMLVAQAKRAAEIFLGTSLPDEIIPKIVRKIRLETENLILIGMPGCGKSTAARRLSALMGREWIDTDLTFPAYADGMTPAECITTRGEKAFRALETRAVADAGKESGKIIATGGGVPTISENYDLLHQNGVILWIDRDIYALSTKGRPLSQGRDVETLYREREPSYLRFADAKVKSCAAASDTAMALQKAFENAII